MILKTDYHIHTKLCGHAKGTPAEYVQAAINKGFGEIGFADHSPAPPEYDPKHRMTLSQFDGYVSEIERLQKKYTNIRIRLGIETDYYPGFESYLSKLRKNYPIEYAIGSVHFLNGNPIFHSDTIDCSQDQAEKLITGYFDGFLQLIQSGLIDILGHFDLIKWVLPHASKIINRVGYKLLHEAAIHGTILEVNTSGLRKQPQEIYPAPAILEKAFCLDIPICLNSDAHQPDDVGADFHNVQPILETIGYNNTIQHRSGLQVRKNSETMT